MADESSNFDEDDSDVIVAKMSAAIDDRDAKHLFQLILDQQFVLISINEDEDEDDADAMGAITAEVEDYEVLVAFTSESLAEEFINVMGDMFGENDQVQGFIVEGDALLEYLPENYGLLLNPETDHTALVEPTLVRTVIAIIEDK